MSNNQPPSPVPSVGKTDPPVISSKTIIGFILAILLPPIGLVICLLAIRDTQRHNPLKTNSLARAGVIISTLLTGALVLVAIVAISLAHVFSALTGGGHVNQAEQDLKPILSQVAQLGGKEICHNGDNGFSLDNTEPWYQAYYTAPANDSITQKVKDISSRQGFSLYENTSFINELKGLPNKDGTFHTPYGNETFNDTSDYLIGRHGGASLTVTINRNTAVALYCNTGEYGRFQSTDNAEILNFQMILPSTNK